jgi:hypothetical protein
VGLGGDSELPNPKIDHMPSRMQGLHVEQRGCAVYSTMITSPPSAAPVESRTLSLPQTHSITTMSEHNGFGEAES